MKNHLGQYECKLCLTLHNTEVRLFQTADEALREFLTGLWKGKCAIH